MTEEELMEIQRLEDAAMDSVDADNAGFIKAQERNQMFAKMDAEQAKAEAAFFAAASSRNRGNLLASAPKASVPVQQVRQAPKPASKAFAKQEESTFKAQLNKAAQVGDSGGAGAKLRAKPPTPAEGPSKVTINKGDTLWALSQKYGISVDELRELNGGVDPRRLQIGHELKLRQAAEAPAEQQATGPSALAQKLAAMQEQKQGGVPYRALMEGFHNNPDNTAFLDTAGNYMNAGATVGGVLAVPKMAGLLASAARKRVPQAMLKSSEEMANRLFPQGSVLRRTRRMYDE